MLALPPLSLYIHIPWCIKKCPYCDFNSHEAKHIPEAEYINALIADLQQDRDDVQGRKLHSIFFGGGTPSLFSPQGIERILLDAEKQIGFESDIEITLEANPGTVEQKKFQDFKSAGINRLSMGIQSFQDNHLRKLGRIHSGDEAKSAIKAAQQAGFDNVNLDLMHGLPEQTLDNALSDLQMAMEFSPSHLSWYQLTIEPNTVFFREKPPLPVDDILAEIQAEGQSLLQQHGYAQYEVSAYARDKQQAKHNINYWQFGDYLGIGAGAHAKITDGQHQRIIRQQKTRLPEHYLAYQVAPHRKSKIVDQDDLTLEFMMNALRLVKGVPKQYFVQRTGIPFSTIESKIVELYDKGLLKNHPTTLVTTALGQQYLNSVLSLFMH